MTELKDRCDDVDFGSALIDRLGGTRRVAAMFGVSPPSVSRWRINGVPKSRRHSLALMRPDVVPDDWFPPGWVKDGVSPCEKESV